MSVCACIAVGWEGEVDSDFVLASQVGVGDLGVWYFEGGAVGNVEGEFGLAKVGLTPIPAAQGMFAVVQVDAVPRFEYLCDTIEVVLLETVELYDTIVAR